MANQWDLVSSSSTMPCYTYRDLVVVSHVNSFEDFFVQSYSDLPALLDLQDRIDEAERTSKLEPMSTPDLSGVVLARYSSENRLYRAQIVEVDGKSLSVHFMDFGNDEVVSIDDCYTIPEDLVELPEFATACSIVSLFGSRGKTEEARDVFKKLVAEKEVLMEVMDCEMDRMLVDLLIMECPGGWQSCRIGSETLCYCYPGMNSVRTLLLMFGMGVLSTGLPRRISFAKFANLQQLIPDSTHYARISAVETPTRFSLQFLGIGDNTGEDLKRHLRGMRATYDPCLLNQMHRVYEPRIGDYVAVYKKDSYARFLRAQIEAVPKRLLVNIRFLDSGIRETVVLSDIFTLQPEFLELPLQAVDVKLHGVIARKNKNGEEIWPKAAYTLLKRYSTKEYVNILVEKVTATKILSPGDEREALAIAFEEGELPKFTIEVSIFHPKTGESLGDKLIAKKLAKLARVGDKPRMDQ